MTTEIQFHGLENLIKKMGATKIPWELSQEISKIDVQGPIEHKDKTLTTVLDDFEMDDLGIMYKDGRAWILHIKEPKSATIDDLENNPKISEDVPRYHIIGNCRTLEDMKRRNRKDRYVTTDILKESFEVYGYEKKSKFYFATGRQELVTDVKLGVCINCLKKVNHNQIKIKKDDKTNLQWREEFDVEKWFKNNIQEKFLKPKYSTKNYPKPGYNAEFDRKKRQLKIDCNWKCSNCELDCSDIINRNLIHCDHVSGVTGDNSDENLRVLCIDCHRHLGQNKTVGTKEDFNKCIKLKNIQEKKIFSKS